MRYRRHPEPNGLRGRLEQPHIFNERGGSLDSRSERRRPGHGAPALANLHGGHRGRGQGRPA